MVDVEVEVFGQSSTSHSCDVTYVGICGAVPVLGNTAFVGRTPSRKHITYLGLIMETGRMVVHHKLSRTVERLSRTWRTAISPIKSIVTKIVELQKRYT